MRTYRDPSILDEPLLGARDVIVRPDGTRLRLTLAGPNGGPLVVLAHGYLGKAQGWGIVQRDLVDAGYRVVAFDQRGHGESTVGTDGVQMAAMVDDYVAVLEHVEAHDAVLVAHSMGGFLAVAFAERQPDIAKRHIRGLLLVGAHGGTVGKGSPQNKLQVLLLRVGLMPALLGSKRAGMAIARTLYAPGTPRGFIEHNRAGMAEHDAAQSLPVLREQLRVSLYEGLGRIDVPTVVLCGELDQTCPRWHSERLGAEIPGARNVWLDDVGHMVPVEAPEAIVAQVEALFAGDA